MSALNCFVMLEFDNSKINKNEIKGNKTDVSAEFHSTDFLGIGSLVENLTQKKQKKLAIQQISFSLKYTWYIESIGGKIEDLIEASYKLRK